MPVATNERLRQILSSQSTVTELFIIKALEAILANIDPTLEDQILDEFLPDTPAQQVVLFGRKLGVYSGLSRTKLKATFTRDGVNPLTDADVDDIFAAIGAVTGTAVPLGGGDGSSAEAKKSSESSDKKAAAKPAETKSTAKADTKAVEDKKKEDGSK